MVISNSLSGHIGPNRTSGSDDRQSIEVVIPPLSVIADCIVGQPSMDEADPRLVAIGNQSDFHLGAARGNRMVGLIPSEGEHHFAVGHYLYKLADARVLALGQHPIHATDARIELGFGAHPSDVLGRIGEEREDGGRAGVHHDLAHEFSHH